MIIRRRAITFEEEHLQALAIGSEVTRWYRKDWEPNVLDVSVENVIAALNKVGVSFVLMGTHAINGYRDEARATQDVDVLVVKKDVRKAVRTLEKLFPYLETVENSAVVRFVNPVSQKVVIDVMKPASQAMRVVFRQTVSIGESHRIPDLEMAVISKFLAMKAPNRKRPRRILDLADLMNIVVTNRNTLDLEKLRLLGDKVRPHGGQEISAIIEDIDTDRPIEI